MTLTQPNKMLITPTWTLSIPNTIIATYQQRATITSRATMSGEYTEWLPFRVLAFVQSLFEKRLDPNLPVPPPNMAAHRPTQRTILQHLPENDFFDQTAPESVGDVPLPSFDPGVFDNELMKLKLYPNIDPQDPSIVREPEGNIVEGTYTGTQVALTQAYSRIEQT
jgi:hypothetical protein